MRPVHRSLTKTQNWGNIAPPMGDRLVVGHVTLDHGAEVRTLVPQLESADTPSTTPRAFLSAVEKGAPGAAKPADVDY